MAVKPPRIAASRSSRGENDNRGEAPMTLVDGPPEAVAAYLEWWNGMTRVKNDGKSMKAVRTPFQTGRKIDWIIQRARRGFHDGC